jgi:hypothetical protein
MQCRDLELPAAEGWLVMSSSRFQDYLLRAKSCEQMAGVVTDDAVQTIYRDLAAGWRELARQVEIWGMDQNAPSRARREVEGKSTSEEGRDEEKIDIRATPT